MQITKIYSVYNTPRYSIIFELKDAKIAKNYEASLLGPVRMEWGALILYASGKLLVLDGPIDDIEGKTIPDQKEIIDKMAARIKNTFKV